MLAGLRLGAVGAAVGALGAWAVLHNVYGDRIEQEITRCNADKLMSVAEAADAAREAEREAAQEQIARYARIAASQQKARQIVADALREAENKPAKIREVIRNVPRETMSQKCLDLPVPDSVLRELRN